MLMAEVLHLYRMVAPAYVRQETLNINNEVGVYATAFERDKPKRARVTPTLSVRFGLHMLNGAIAHLNILNTYKILSWCYPFGLQL